MCLESILKKLGCNKAFLKNGKLSKSGNKTYNLLIDIIYSLPFLTNKITVEQVDKIIDDLDKIEYENY